MALTTKVFKQRATEGREGAPRLRALLLGCAHFKGCGKEPGACSGANHIRVASSSTFCYLVVERG